MKNPNISILTQSRKARKRNDKKTVLNNLASWRLCEILFDYSPFLLTHRAIPFYTHREKRNLAETNLISEQT